jgi:hypothetical protein
LKITSVKLCYFARETFLCITLYDTCCLILDPSCLTHGADTNTWQEENQPEQALVFSFLRNFQRFMKVEFSLQFLEDSLFALNLSDLNTVCTPTSLL